MAEMVAKSKVYKAEKAKIREEQLDLTEEVDDTFDKISHLLVQRKNKKEERESNNNVIDKNKNNIYDEEQGGETESRKQKILMEKVTECSEPKKSKRNLKQNEGETIQLEKKALKNEEAGMEEGRKCNSEEQSEAREKRKMGDYDFLVQSLLFESRVAGYFFLSFFAEKTS